MLEPLIPNSEVIEVNSGLSHSWGTYWQCAIDNMYIMPRIQDSLLSVVLWFKDHRDRRFKSVSSSSDAEVPDVA